MVLNSQDGSNGSEAGIGLLDGLIALTVFSLSAFGFLSFTLSGQALEVETRDRLAAASFARQVMEEVRRSDFTEVFASYNGDPTDDPRGAGTAPGDQFTSKELGRLLGSATEEIGGLLGHTPLPTVDPNAVPDSTVAVVFPTDGTGLQIREDIIDPALGMPRDLNGDGLIDAANHAGDALFLPVQVQVVYQTGRGPKQVTLHTVLTAR